MSGEPAPDATADVVDRLARAGVVPVVVIDDATHADGLGDALVAAGITAVEVTLRTTAGLDVVRRLAARGDLLVGAGTVLTAAQVDEVADTGATFVVSPGLDADVVARCLDRGVLPLPGVATATEVQRAVSLGLSVLKFFPSSQLGGLPTMSALAGPFPGVRFFPSGGVGPDEARDLLASELVVAVGASWVAPRSDIAAGDLDGLATRAKAALARVLGDGHSGTEPAQRASDPTEGTPIVTLGETMLLFHPPGTGTLAHTPSVAVGIGGAESNVAIALARLGAPATWVGVVGDDGAGDRIVRELRGEGVDLIVRVDPYVPTAVMLKERPTPGTARITYHRRGNAGSRIGPADVPLDAIRSASCLHVTGITPALSDSARDAVLLAVDTAVAAGVPVSFDVNHRPSLWRDRDPVRLYRRLASAATLVFAGEDEARLLLGDDVSVDADVSSVAAALAAFGPRHAVVKRGADGCVAVVDGVQYERAAVPVAVVDTVGAGDAFVAGYLAEFVSGLPVEGCLETAVTVGAFQCSVPGDWEGLPRRRDLALLAATEPVTR
ncbi:bifunctional 4-hydroxy-2-oxoglutarate aldolase/2-dehydro-3-deoxy-phosphogluconate aldolase [Labedella gwakjiensis]|uniref:bifunctional 4-hydroxy-2-oxoglutarate aldolase/2-dehydro-3-deoxy-phosphogluconate aldolase n=1 Tax=Labedella gwakjiensis TaxID=390269 RepID=UPI0013047F80|nr:bifunctional 4-hydroxy-2-oxoglutarate aldolase/2-dehydro-3-deoxy-phosphogluconate aldolase [Labedella gwakjiensis]